MNGKTGRFARFGAGLLGLVVMGCMLTGQAARSADHKISLPTDWSHRHLIFSRPGSPEQMRRVSHNLRYAQQEYRLEQRLTLAPAAGSLEFHPSTSKKLHRDWAEDLGSGGSVGAGNYPAKFSFDIKTTNCGSAPTPDYVVYSTGLSGTSGQASVVAYFNLYSGCGGTVPSVYWAYNTSGQILTSPVLALDGTQVAFVQTNAGHQGTLVILKWAPSGASVTAPTLVLPGAYRACTPGSTGCMTTIQLQDHSGTPTDDTTSSVYYDYDSDTAWVGGAVGWLHKITGMFNGTPTEVNVSGGFPVQVNSGNTLSSPVFDQASNSVFVGDAGGYLYRVDATSAAVTQSAQLDFGTGIVEGPVVDSTHGLVYVFASSDNTFLCNGGSANCAAVYQLTTTFGAGAGGSEAMVGASVPSAPPNPNPLYIGGFDSAYTKSTNATGNLYVCGNTGAFATLYQVPIAAGAIPASGLAVTALATSGNAPCSPVTDVPNPNTTGGFSERLFVSVASNGRASACSSGGCIFNFVSAPWKASTAYAIGQQLLSTKLHTETVITAGTSGSTEPSWSNAAGGKITDGGVTWIDQGTVQASTFPGWTASHLYSSTTIRIVDTNNNLEAPQTTGTSGTGMPSWNPTPGLTTLDRGVVWINLGPVPSSALPSAGGASGVVWDNVVGSGTLAGASQVYFSTLSDQTCATSGGTGGCAVQASQPALQ